MKDKIEIDVLLEINESEQRKLFNKELEELTKSIEEYRPIISEIIDYYIKYASTRDFKEFIISGFTSWLTSKPTDAKKVINQEYDTIIDHLNRINRR